MSQQHVTVKLHVVEFETDQNDVGFILQSPWLEWEK